MNLIKILLFSTLTFSAFATDRMVCQEYNRDTQKLLNRTVILNALGPATEKFDDQGEYVAYQSPYSLELYEGVDFSPIIRVKGIALTEDVWFEFNSNDSKVNFTMYFDEQEEAGLSLTTENGKEISDFICRVF